MPSRLTESRKSRRLPLRCWVKLTANGLLMWARVVETSATGVTLESLLPIPAGLAVRIRARSVHLIAGCAQVRHCARRGLKFRIGLEFDTPVTSRF